MLNLDPAAVHELDQLCDHARRVVDANRHLPVREAGPAVAAALTAIRTRLVTAGVDEDVAVRTADRWFITGRPIPDCLVIEADPPYPLTRFVPGVARTNPSGTGR